LLSTVWNTQRDSQSSTEKRRGRKEIEVTRRRGGGVKRKDHEKILEIIIENFPKMGKEIATKSKKPRESQTR